MYENLSQEELEMVLEAGLEKVAYEEGINEYVESLEKVAAVHDVDAEELHDFLEKQANPQIEGEAAGRLDKLKGVLGNLSPKQKAALGLGTAAAGVGAGVGAKKLRDKKKEDKEKTAAAYGLDEETFDFLVENGIEALSQ